MPDIRISEPRKDQVVGVIGPAGFGGSYLCVELLRRGHAVIGLSRNPETFGTCEGYTPRGLDIESVSIEDLAKSFSDIDVLVSQYGPHTQGAGALQYSKRLHISLLPVSPWLIQVITDSALC